MIEDTTAVFLHRRGGTRRWDDLSRAEQCKLNRNRRAMGLQPRLITAASDVVASDERTEEADVPVGISA